MNNDAQLESERSALQRLRTKKQSIGITTTSLRGRRKLTDAQVPEVIRRYKAGESSRALSVHYQVSQKLITLVARGKYRNKEARNESATKDA